MRPVVVIGGGAAGLAAFQQLRQQGCDTVLLEARERLGGRIWTLTPPNWRAPVELGAEFLHSPFPELEAEEAASGRDWSATGEELRPAERGGRAARTVGDIGAENRGAERGDPPPANEEARTRPSRGPGAPGLAERQAGRTAEPGGAPRRSDELAGGVNTVFERLQAWRGPDQSFAAFLEDESAGLSAATRSRALAFIQGYEAADAGRISVVSLQREFAAAGDWGDPRRPRGGYTQLLQRLQSLSGIHLAAPVRRIAWGPGSVVVTTPQQEIAARAALVTLPLSLLQRRDVAFVPLLNSKRSALAGLAMGGAVRVVLRFQQRVWSGIRDDQENSLKDLRFLFGGSSPFPTWWTHPAAPQITGWAGGPNAERLTGLPPLQICSRALDSLAALLRVPRRVLERNLIEAHTHDWQSDPFSRGAYSYACVGGADAHAELAQPLLQTLFFAGEATDSSGHHATVAGAVASGRRAAAELLQIL